MGEETEDKPKKKKKNQEKVQVHIGPYHCQRDIFHYISWWWAFLLYGLGRLNHGVGTPSIIGTAVTW